MKKSRNGKGEKRILEETIERLANRRKTPPVVFVILLLLYLILSVVVRKTSTSDSTVILGGAPVPVNTLTGVFSTVSNLCLILTVVLGGTKGFVASLVILLTAYPMLINSIFFHGNYRSIPGLFVNLLTIVAITVIYINNKKVERYQIKLREQATTDLLTGLPNFFASTELISELIKEHKPFAAVTINISGINSINNTVGYDMGNKVFIEFASRWRQIANEGLSDTLDFISRISGDEFSLIIQHYGSDKDIVNTIRLYEEALTRKITIEGYDFSLTGSFGYAVFPSDADNLDSLISYSNLAMREVKRLNNGDPVLRITPELMNTQDKLIIENKVRDALENDLIYFNLQPQFDMSHKLRGFEVLARMKDIEGYIIRPDEFIPAAERLGLISSIDLTVHKKATAFFSSLLRKTGADLTLSLNVSVKHMMKSDFMDEIKKLVRESGIPARQLEIEITESILIESAEKASRNLAELREMGIKIAIDDFGTGYSSLSYLNSFPSDILKIDKSFIDDMNTSATSQKYVEAIISLAHVMDLKVIAEGAEEEEQLETLGRINCDYIQGFIWGKPLPAEEAEALVTRSV